MFHSKPNKKRLFGNFIFTVDKKKRFFKFFLYYQGIYEIINKV